MKKFIQIILYLSLLSSCGFDRTVIISNSLGKENSVSTYYIESLKIGKTLAISTELSNQTDQIQEILIKKLADNGFLISTIPDADFKLTAIIEAAPNGYISPEELRFMKGAHGNRSNFPDANPRVRNLESDYLIMIMLSKADNKIIFHSKCRLIESQNAVDQKSVPLLKTEDAVSCIEELVSKL